MRVTVKKWGNSAAVRIPAAVMAAARVSLDQAVEVREEDGRIIIEPVRPKGYNLAALVAAITDDNRHDSVETGPVRTRLGACHLGALSLDGGLTDPMNLAALARAFPRFMVLEEAPSRDAATVMRAARAERASVPLLWRGEDSRLLAALSAGAPGPVALLCEDAAAPAILPVLACLTGMLRRKVVLFCPSPETLPSWPSSGPLAVRAEEVSAAPIDAFFAPESWARSRPAFVLEHRHPRASLPAREVALRAGIAHLRFDDPVAPAVVSTVPAMAYRTRGFVSTALVLGRLDRFDGAVPLNAGAAEEYGRDAGWARLWGELGRLLAA